MDCLGSLKNDFRHCARHLAQDLWDQLKRKSCGHWFIALFLIVAGTVLGHKLGEYNIWIDLRYAVYQFFLEHTALRTPHPRRTVVVLIGDEEYHRGPLARRYPLKRDYLAELIEKLDKANPEVIALDVSLGSPIPEEGTREIDEYQAETNKLLEAVRTASRNRTVVLAKSVKYAEEGKFEFEAEPSVFDDFNFEGGKVRRGYIELPRDKRRVPSAMTLKDGTKHDSFASAIARAVDEKSLADAQKEGNDALPYGTFIRPEGFRVYPAAQVLNSDPESLKEDLAFRVVIVGGRWHKFGPGRGPKIDSHPSPVGDIFGAFVHANYVEALLDARTYQPMSEGAAVAVEILAAAILAVFLGLEIRLALKLGVALLVCLVVVVISYAAWQNMGLFFDFFIPVVLLLGHVVVEKIIE